MRMALTAAAILAALVGSAEAQGLNRRCLHGRDETQPNRERREKAVELAEEIHLAEGKARGFTPRGSGPFLPLEQLRDLPETPEGFRAELQTDGTAYLLSIKDTQDPCGYAVFSDDSGSVYEAVPSTPRARVRLLSRD